MMMEDPTKEEVERLVMSLPKDKSSGIDGVTIEMLLHFWPIMKPVCTKLIKAFWRDGTLTTKVVAGVIKLIPKNHEIVLLLNWRSLTMLTLAEKLCAIFLANRIKKPTNKVIDKQQTGFLEGRNIMDNFLMYRLAKEMVTKTRVDAILLKAGFMKAYDRIEHLFVWETM